MSTAAIEPLEAELSRINAWRVANVDKVETPEFRRTTAVLSVLINLIGFNGGTPAQRADAAEQLRQIEDGTYPDLQQT